MTKQIVFILEGGVSKRATVQPIFHSFQQKDGWRKDGTATVKWNDGQFANIHKDGEGKDWKFV